MPEPDSAPSEWTRSFWAILAVFLILLVVLFVYAVFMGLLWTIGVGLVYVIFIPLLVFIDARTKRNPLLVLIVQICILLPLIFLFSYLSNLYLASMPELQTPALFLFALTILFAGGLVFLVLRKSLAARQSQKE